MVSICTIAPFSNDLAEESWDSRPLVGCQSPAAEGAIPPGNAQAKGLLGL